MQASPTPASDFAYRLAIILAGLAALIVRRFARDRFHEPLIRPLYAQITHAARRLGSVFARLAAGLPSRPRAAKPHSGPHSKPVLPTRPAWLIRALGSEAAGYASQLKFLLAEPAAADALANSVAARRILAPISRMLGLAPSRRRRPRPRPKAAPPPLPASAAVRPTPPPWLRDPPPTRSARPYLAAVAPPAFRLTASPRISALSVVLIPFSGVGWALAHRLKLQPVSQCRPAFACGKVGVARDDGLKQDRMEIHRTCPWVGCRANGYGAE